MSFATVPARMLTPAELQQYESDGVLMVRQAIAPNWLALVAHGGERARANPSLIGRFMSRKTPGYQTDTFLWKRVDELRDAIYYGPFAHWAQQLMASQTVRCV